MEIANRIGGPYHGRVARPHAGPRPSGLPDGTAGLYGQRIRIGGRRQPTEEGRFAHRPSNPRRGSDQAVRLRDGPRRDRLHGPARHRVRAARPQRRRQDHRDPHPHHHPAPRRRPGRGAGHRRGPLPDRPGRPVRRGRRQPDRPGESAPDRPARADAQPRGARPDSRAAGAVRPGGGGRPAGADLLGRDAPPAGRGRRAGVAAAGAVPGRAHHRAGHPEPRRAVADDPRAGGRGHHGTAHHPVPGGGRPPVPAHRRGRPWPGDRQRHAGGAQGPSRQHGHRAGHGRRDPRLPGPGPAVGDAAGAARATGGHHPPGLAGRRARPDRRAALPRRPGPHAGDAGRARTEPGRRLPLAHRPAGRRRRFSRWAQTPGRCRMTATTPAAISSAEVRRDRANALGPVRDALAIAGRNLIALRRVPRLLVFSTIQPVVFLLLFRYVFGGVVSTSLIGVPYVDSLLPGVFVQTSVFGAIGAAIGLATDLQNGLLERFRSLPMARSAVLAGRTLADLARNVFVVALMVVIGFGVGFRVHTGPLPFLGGMLLVLLFAYSMSWVFATAGLLVGDPETAQAAAFPVMAPLVFASSVFVPVSSMPGWLQGFATHQPVSVTASVVRALTLGGPTASDVWQSLAWAAGIVAVFAPLAVWRYRRAV